MITGNMDVLICGLCSKRFNSLRTFVRHKKLSRVTNCSQHGSEQNSCLNEKFRRTENGLPSRNLTLQEDGLEPDKTTTLLRSDARAAFVCCKCKKMFHRLRHLNNHHCAQNVHTQDNKKLDLQFRCENRTEVDQDRSPDFRVYMTVNEPPWTRKNYRAPTEAKTTHNNASDSSSNKSEPLRIPVFNTEDQKQSFCDRQRSIGLTCLANMYTQHMVSQELTESDLTLRKKNAKDLTVFSCNTCKKVFHSESHVRVHCLSHTSLKPFSCTECDFTSNSRGSLQTHMRLHTGNTFQCDKCSFKTGNASHLREHKETHLSGAVKCKLCRHFYKTRKSLRNHVMRYHNSSAGKKYLATFRSQTKCSMATLHLCQICNKKYKRKCDRDRHQSLHQLETEHLSSNLCLEPSTFSGNGRSLEGVHPNNVVPSSYACCLCKELFPNSETLQVHLHNHLHVANENQRHATRDVSERVSCSEVLKNQMNSFELVREDDETVTPDDSCLKDHPLDNIRTSFFSDNLISVPQQPLTQYHCEIEKKLLPVRTEASLPEVDAEGKDGTSYQCPHCPKIFKRSTKDLQRHLHVHRLKTEHTRLLPKTVTDTQLPNNTTNNQEDHDKSEVLQSVSADNMDSSNQASNEEHSSHIEKLVFSDATKAAQLEQQLYSCLSCSTSYLNFWQINLHMKETHGIMLEITDVVTAMSENDVQ